MAAIIIPNHTTFGSMTNQLVARINALHSMMARLQDAVATASAGYTGTPGTEFEQPMMGDNMMQQNNFGIQPDPETPGQKGTDYAYALNVLSADWATFWAAAKDSIEQLDNGTF